MTDQSRLINAEEARNILHISHGAFFNLVARGAIPRLKIGRSARYRISDVNAYIDRLAEEATDWMSSK